MFAKGKDHLKINEVHGSSIHYFSYFFLTNRILLHNETTETWIHKGKASTRRTESNKY